MHILISTNGYDPHAAIVAMCLHDLNHQVSYFCGADFPTQMKISLNLASQHPYQLKAQDLHHSFTLHALDTVWNRRHRPYDVSQDLHPADQAFVHSECSHFSEGVRQLTGLNAFWVNHRAAARELRKPTQLVVAQQLGLQIPETLMSNDPAEIRQFVKNCPNGAIYKPFSPAGWIASEGKSLCYTTEVNLQEMDSDESLQNAPGIFQEQLPKAYEIRATFMGSTYFAARINSQSSTLAKTDWRRGKLESLHLEPTTLPETIRESCRHFMSHFGIVFGCFDFIVTPDHKYYFLEVNEAGQFFFLEQQLPQLPVLDAFTQFLLQRDPAFTYQPPEKPVSFFSYWGTSRLKDFLTETHKNHRNPPDQTIQSELTSQ